MDDRTRLLSISDVVAATGLRASALRFYEDEGLIAPAARVGGRRHYDPSVLRRLAIVALCQEVGFTVADIRQLVRTPTAGRRAWRHLAQLKLADIDAHIEKAKAARALLEQVLACGCDDPAGCQMVSGAGERRLLQLGTAAPAADRA